MSYVFGKLMIGIREIFIVDDGKSYLFIDIHQEVAKRIDKNKEVLNFLGALYKYSSSQYIFASSNWKALGLRYFSLHSEEDQECLVPKEIAGIFTGIKFPVKMAIKDCHVKHK